MGEAKRKKVERKALEDLGEPQPFSLELYKLLLKFESLTREMEQSYDKNYRCIDRVTTLTPLKERRVVRGDTTLSLAEAIAALRQPTPLSIALKDAMNRMNESVARYARLLGDDYKPYETK